MTRFNFYYSFWSFSRCVFPSNGVPSKKSLPNFFCLLLYPPSSSSLPRLSLSLLSFSFLSVFFPGNFRSEGSFSPNLPTWWKSTRRRRFKRRLGKHSVRCPILSKRLQIWPTSKGLERPWHQVTRTDCMIDSFIPSFKRWSQPLSFFPRKWKTNESETPFQPCLI